MALDPNAIITLAEVNDHFGLPGTDTATNEVLERFINRASGFVEGYLDRDLLLREYTEIQDGTRANSLVLHNYPIVSISSLRTLASDNTFDDPATEIDADQFVLEPGSVIRLLRDRLFPRGTMNVRIIYESGYRRSDQVGTAPLVPYDIAYATVLMVEYYYQSKQDRSLGVSSKSRNNQNVSLIHGTPQEVIDLLSPHKRIQFPALNLPITNA